MSRRTKHLAVGFLIGSLLGSIGTSAVLLISTNILPYLFAFAVALFVLAIIIAVVNDG